MKISRNGKSNLSYFHNKLIVFKFVAENYTYNYKQTINANLLSITRGYCAHEHWNQFGLIDMNFAIKREQSEYVITYSSMPSVSKMGEANGRFYDPVVGRFLSPDPYVQDPGNPQNFNRYSYCLNNPLKYTDPSGESIIGAVIIGAVVGTYIGGAMANNTYNPCEWNYSSGRTWGYMCGGAIVGAASGYIGGVVACSGMPFANTYSIMAASFTYSVGTSIYTNGQTPVSINFGVASYNMTDNQWGYLGKKENKTIENVGYGLGAMANVSDLLAGLHPQNIELRTENNPNYSNKGDKIGHTQLNSDGEILVDWGPVDTKTSTFGLIEGTNEYEGGNLLTNLKGSDFWNPIKIDGINLGRIYDFSERLYEGGSYNLIYNNCVAMGSRTLNMAGAFNIGIHPYLLHAQMYLRSIGMRPSLYSYYLNQ